MRNGFLGGRLPFLSSFGLLIGSMLAGLLIFLPASGVGDADALVLDNASEGLGPAFLLGGPTGSVPALFDQVRPAVACDTTGSRIHLAVWEDHRSGDADIFATRLDSSGTLLDAVSFPIAVGSPRQASPAVAFDGENFFVVWESHDGIEWSIRGARVTPDGDLLDATSIVIADAVTPLETPAVAFDGAEYMVLWSDSRDGAAEIYGTRVSTAGEVITTNVGRIASGTGDLTTPALAYGDGHYLVLWADEFLLVSEAGDSTHTADIGGVFLSPSSGIADSVLIVAQTEQMEITPDVTFDGSEFLAIWAHRRDQGTQFVFGRRVSTAEGVRPDSISIGREINGHERGLREDPAVVFDGENYLVTWALTLTYYGIYGATVRLEDEEVTVSDRILLADVTSGHNALAWDGVRYAVVYSTLDGDDEDIAGTFVNASQEVVGPEQIIGLASFSQVTSSVAWDGTNYFVVWEEQCESSWRVRGGRVSPDGDLLDPDGIALLPDTSEVRRYPRIALGEDAYLLTWIEQVGNSTSIYGQRIDLSGAALSAAVEIDGGGMADRAPCVEWGGDNFLVTWVNSRGWAGIAGRRIEPSADSLVFVDATPLVLHVAGGCSSPAVVFDGTNYFIVWGEERTNMRGLWLSPSDETAGDPLDLATAFDPSAPTIAFDGSLYFIMWEDDEGSIYSVRVNPSGVVIDPGKCLLAEGSGVGERPAIVFDGHARLALWRAQGSGSWQMAGGRLGTDGSVLDPGVFAAADEYPMQRWPLAVSGGGGEILITYSALVVEEGQASLRAAGKIWSQVPPELTLAVHQNPAVTSDIAVYILPSESLDSLGVHLHANGEPLDLSLTDAERSIYRGCYRALATETVTILASGRDLTGNTGNASRSFTVGLVTPDSGGVFACPSGVVSLNCPPGAVAGNTFLVILPDRAWDADLAADDPRWADREWEFLLSPANLMLRKPTLLTVEVPEGRHSVLERETLTGWEGVEARYYGEQGMLEASISQLGRYRVRWIEDGGMGSARLTLGLGPDPFRGDLTIRYLLPGSGQVQLAIFDVGGRRVRTLANGKAESGWHSAAWDGRDGAGRRVASGVYFTRLVFETDTVTRRCLLVR
jgi:hypothetical protein